MYISSATPNGADTLGEYDEVRWRQPPVLPLDHGGPEHHPFEPFSDVDLSTPIFATFKAITAKFPTKVAVRDLVSDLTYSDLMAASLLVARRIRLGADVTDIIGILLPNNASFTVAALGCLAAGRPYIALDLHYPVERNLEIIKASGMTLLLVSDDDPGHGYDLPRNVRRLALDRILREADGPGMEAPETDIDAPAVILYTSGSTGRPSGIVNSQRNILQRVAQHVNATHAGSSDVFLPLSSPSTIAGTREAISPLLIGGQLYALDPRKAGLAETRRVMRDARVTICYSVPALARSLMEVRECPGDFDSLRIFRVGGERVLTSDIAMLRRQLPQTCHLQISYSSTETTGAQWFVRGDLSRYDAVPPVGYLLPGIEYAVLDGSGNQVEPGLVGELVVRGPYVALGHWRHGRVDASDFPTDPGDPTFRIFRVGDLVRVGPDGMMFVVGRKDRQVKIRGQRVEPAELEVLLRKSPAVADAAVTVRTTGASDSLVAFVVPRSRDDTAFLDELRLAVRSTLPAAMQPAAIHIIPELPRLPGSKVDENALRAFDLRHAPPAVSVVPVATPRFRDVERAVLHAWKSLLDSRSVALNQTWEEAGGDSLKFLAFSFMVEESLQHRLNIESFQPTMRLSEFVASVRDDLSGSRPVVADARPVIHLFPGILGDEPALAALRSDLAEEFRFVVLDYPDFRTSSGPEIQFSDLVALAVQQVVSLDSAEPIRLMGYSFGALVAYGAAVQLLEDGRTISFFGVIDSNLSRGQVGHGVSLAAPRAKGLRHLIAFLRRDDLQDNICRAIARRMAEQKGRYVLRHFGRWSRLLPAPKFRYAIHSWAVRYLRLEAVQAWLDARERLRLPLGVTLFRTDDHPPTARRDLGWGVYAECVDIVDVSGDHVTQLHAPHRQTIVTGLTDAIGRVTA